MRRLIFQMVTAGFIAIAVPVAALAEVNEVSIAQQYGIAYLQFLVMQRDSLIEKQLAKSGLPDVKVTWRKFAGSNVMYDAVFSGDLQIASGGLTPLLTVWAKTRSSYKVRGMAAMNSMPLLLNSRVPNVKTIADLTARDKIALPAVKISQQAITLEMAAAKAFGPANFARLDPLTVSMSHPDGMLALESKVGEVTAHFSAPPFQYQELDDPRIHTILDSAQVVGGSTTFTVLWATSEFRDKNPRVYHAVLEAFRQATEIVNADKRGAAELYVASEHPKLTVDQVYKILTAPGMEFTMTPAGVMKYADFMFAHGLIKEMPATWKDVFFPDIDQLPGN